MEPQAAREMLRSAGFSQCQIDCLMKLRQKIASTENYQATAMRRRLEFVRWLFVTGRLTE